MKPENKLSKDWNLLLNRVPRIDGHESIENGVSNGTPDKMFTIAGVNGWAELKVAKEPKRGSTCVKLPHWSRLQRQWMQARISCPNVFLVVRIGEWDYIFDTHTMFTIETTPYAQLKKHPWRIKLGEPKEWTHCKLLLLSDKLRGIDNLKQKEENNNEH
jgi:hypothetical protein